MAITKSAKKAHRASLNKRVFNVRRKKALGSASRDILDLIAAGKKAEAAKALPAAYKAIDKAAKRGVLKPNTASRKKSRIALALAKLG